jgi:hypothetical protein
MLDKQILERKENWLEHLPWMPSEHPVNCHITNKQEYIIQKAIQNMANGFMSEDGTG